MLTRIHVNQHVIRANKKYGNNAAPLRVIQRGRSRPASRVVIQGPAEVVYSPDKPLSCGARCWVETKAEVSWE